MKNDQIDSGNEFETAMATILLIAVLVVVPLGMLLWKGIIHFLR
jgi:hypothetical protein